MTSNIATVSSVDSNEGKQKDELQIPRIGERLTEEIVIALVGPLGSGCTKTYSIIKDILSDEYDYDVRYHHLSKFINLEANSVGLEPATDMVGPDRINHLQTVGDKLREKFGDKYLAAKAVEQIAKQRDVDGFGKTTAGNRVPKKLRRIHVIDSLKHPDEIDILKATYGDIFWLIGVIAPLSIRRDRLEYQKKYDGKDLNFILERDYVEGDDHGQNVRDVFFQADFFLRNDKEDTIELKQSIGRFIEIIFGSSVHTPTLDESSMYAAYSEAAKSGCLSRQVGAAIVSPKGELIGVGRNDVPSFGGGLYTEGGSCTDHRCHSWKGNRCNNDAKKEELYRQIFRQLVDKKLLKTSATLAKVTKAVKSTDVKSLIEYSRAVHAEMDAITSIARTHTAGILDGTLYSTTYPCHSCTRHIVASGITRVYFIEPYPKSLAVELHSDSASEEDNDVGSKVVFLQYTGIAPKNILRLFKSGIKRKDSRGRLIKFDKRKAIPIVSISLDDYATHEKLVIEELVEDEKK